VQQLESDINDLLKQLKHGETCYDNLLEENKTLRYQELLPSLRNQVETLMKDEQRNKSIETELQ
jgi:regulator of replication initiation timing